MNICYSNEVNQLIKTPIPEFLSSEWHSYLIECSKAIESRKHGWWFLKRKLIKDGYAVTKDGSVLPF